MASVLQITPHAVFPPRGGRRAFFFLREMAREHQVVAILPQTLDSLRGTREGYSFPPTLTCAARWTRRRRERYLTGSR
jgi:hypothetical protein